jgi:hypothetical protein
MVARGTDPVVGCCCFSMFGRCGEQIRPAGARSLAKRIPFFALSAAAAATTYLVQAGSGAVRALGPVRIGLRIGTALVSYVIYAAKMFWPARLAVFYPYAPAVPVWRSAVTRGITLVRNATMNGRHSPSPWVGQNDWAFCEHTETIYVRRNCYRPGRYGKRHFI